LTQSIIFFANEALTSRARHCRDGQDIFARKALGLALKAKRIADAMAQVPAREQHRSRQFDCCGILTLKPRSASITALTKFSAEVALSNTAAAVVADFQPINHIVENRKHVPLPVSRGIQGFAWPQGAAVARVAEIHGMKRTAISRNFFSFEPHSRRSCRGSESQ